MQGKVSPRALAEVAAGLVVAVLLFALFPSLLWALAAAALAIVLYGVYTVAAGARAGHDPDEDEKTR